MAIFGIYVRFMGGSQIWKSSPIFRGEHKKIFEVSPPSKPWAASNRESLFCSASFQVKQPMFVFGGVSLEESGILPKKKEGKNTYQETQKENLLDLTEQVQFTHRQNVTKQRKKE